MVFIDNFLFLCDYYEKIKLTIKYQLRPLLIILKLRIITGFVLSELVFPAAVGSLMKNRSENKEGDDDVKLFIKV